MARWREGEVRKLVQGKYELGRMLGQGSFAKVYYGRHLRDGQSVAIKVINKARVRQTEGMVEQLRREISIMRMVRHPHVVRIKEVLASRERVFVVMEYARGGELFAKVAHGRLTEDTARRYFQQLVAAVGFCHSRGVAHRVLRRRALRAALRLPPVPARELRQDVPEDLQGRVLDAAVGLRRSAPPHRPAARRRPRQAHLHPGDHAHAVVQEGLCAACPLPCLAQEMGRQRRQRG